MLDKLPQKLIERLKLIYTKDELEIIEKWFNIPYRKTSFRVNTIKSTKEEIEKILREKEIEFEKISFLENWYKLINEREKSLWEKDIYKEWKIYLQWITSQLPVSFLEFKNWEKVLDLTASPGSKTSQISAKLNNSWEIVANEISKIRLEKLKYTINKQGCENVIIINKDATHKVFEFDNYFDKILLDAPCSSEWKINLNNDKIWSNWTMWNIKRNYNIQKEILKNNISLLKIGWEFVYSTCTLAPEENEWIVHFLLCNYKDLEIIDISSPFENNTKFKKWIKKFGEIVYRKDVEKSLRILPSIDTEWFFVAKFRKIWL